MNEPRPGPASRGVRCLCRDRRGIDEGARRCNPALGGGGFGRDFGGFFRPFSLCRASSPPRQASRRRRGLRRPREWASGGSRADGRAGAAMWTSAWRGLPPLLQADEAFGLAGQIFEGELEGLEPAVKARCTDQAIGRRRGFNHGPGRWKQGHDPGIVVEEMDARDKPREFHGADGPLHVLRGSKSWKEGIEIPPPFPNDLPCRHGPRRSQFHHNIPGRNDDQPPDGGFGGPQHTAARRCAETGESAKPHRRHQAPAGRKGLQ